MNIKVTVIPWNTSLSLEVFKKNFPYMSIVCNSLLEQCFQVCFEVFGSSISIYVFLCPLRLCSFSFPLFFSPSSLLPFTKITLWQGFHPFHQVFLVGMFTALSIFTSLGHHWGIAIVLSGLQLQIKAGHSLFCYYCLTISGSHSAASMQPGSLRAGLSAEEVMLLCVWL